MKIAFYDTRPYDRASFEPLLTEAGHRARFIENRLDIHTLDYAQGADAICVFVNDKVDKAVIEGLAALDIRLILLRSAGYNNVDMQAAHKHGIRVFRVPAYSPAAVAEYAAALLLSVNRKTHKAYGRIREFNFNIDGLTGMDLFGKTAGVVGTGRIGQMMIDILRGFHMNIIAYDLYPNPNLNVDYVSLDELMRRSDIISLHCPLTDETRHLINADSIEKMKPGVLLINTSRGALVDTQALIEGINAQKIGGVGLDVYEEEDSYFFEDWSDKIMKDRDLARLITFPNVLLTSHQAFLTREALAQIARTTLKNIEDYEANQKTDNEICYLCQ
ncbi:MAG: 2-hydroxyacid dehydrogenase [Eubacterium sp.]|nr:2-hydroxyacid dehydrogenase [Eubacterium sp.]